MSATTIEWVKEIPYLTKHGIVHHRKTPPGWKGVRVRNQDEADRLIPLLLQTPAAVRFLSCEPLLSRLELPWLWKNEHCPKHDRPRRIDDQLCPVVGMDWVIVGGESGPGARPCNIAWIRSIVEQCKAAGVACFVKQFGANPQFVDPLDRLNSGPVGVVTQDGDSRRRHKNGAELPRTMGLMILKDKKGGDPAEWPADLRVREYPEPGKVGG